MPSADAPSGRSRVPLVTLGLIVTISTVSLVGYSHQQVFEALERQRGAVGHGQIWRLVTPLLVQTDGWKALLAVMWLLLVVGVVAEPLFGHGRFLTLFLLSGIVGHSVGIAWQPGAGGASVGMLGPVGALVALLLRPGAVRPFGRTLGWAAVLVGGWLVATADIHGPALLAGICAGFVMLTLDPSLARRRSGGRGFDELAALGDPPVPAGAAPSQTPQ
jgi:rhomboid protease GluP